MVNISENTIDKLFYKVRKRLVDICNKESYFTSGEIEIDESYFRVKRIKKTKKERDSSSKTKVFGMKKRGDKVYTQIVNNCSAKELVPIIKKLVLNNNDTTIYSDEWKAYDVLVNVSYKKHIIELNIVNMYLLMVKLI